MNWAAFLCYLGYTSYCVAPLPPVTSFVLETVVWDDVNNLSAMVCRPDDTNEHPAVLWFPGGGWASVDIEADMTEFDCEYEAGQGRVLIVSEYRTGDVAQFPAQRDDVLAAYDWAVTLDHVDAGRVCVGGHSAGGWGAAWVGVMREPVCIHLDEAPVDFTDEEIWSQSESVANLIGPYDSVTALEASPGALIENGFPSTFFVYDNDGAMRELQAEPQIDRMRAFGYDLCDRSEPPCLSGALYDGTHSFFDRSSVDKTTIRNRRETFLDKHLME